MSTERMFPFQLKSPVSLAEVAALLAAEPDSKLLAGGTDLLPNMRRGIERPLVLIELGRVAALGEIAFGGDEASLGAGVTISRLARDATIARRFPAIAQAAASIAGPAHRSAATVGGNLCLDTRCVFYNQSEWWRETNEYCLKRGGTVCHVAPQGNRCHAAFSGDLAPALIALDARVELVAARGTRRVALADLYRDDGAAHLTITRDEVLARVTIPSQPPGSVSGYRKARVRGAMDFPMAGVACRLALRDDGTVGDLRLALTGTNARPLLLAGTEELLSAPVGDEWLARLAKLVQKQVSPMRTSTIHSNHRRQVASVLAQRLANELAGISEKRP